MHSSVSFDAEDFWADLLAYLDEKQVIPIVGEELLEIDEAGEQVPLYRAVASRLLGRYEMTPYPAGGTAASVSEGGVVLRPHHELNDAVCALLRAGHRVQDIYRPLNDTLRTVLSEQERPFPLAYSQLAAIRNFDLFVSTTCDDLLVRTINESRFKGAPQTENIEYAPNLSSEKLHDIPEIRPADYAAVFSIFGKASALPQFAIHDEDILEFVSGLQAGRGYIPDRMMGAVRSRNLLLIGCNFADWLSRFFIRVANQTRLFGDRSKKEFLVDSSSASDGSLTLFLERFSQNTRMFPGTAKEFVAELHRRWFERHPLQKGGPSEQATLPATRTRRNDIFISYSSTDRQAAQRLVEAIQAVGGDVVWYDRHDLSAGDDWSASILGAIDRCSLFLPLISSGTEKRTEGFFRLEWDKACERDRRIQGRKFIYPVVVDTAFPVDTANYSLVPDRFRKYQFGHAPGGAPTDSLREDLVTEIRAMRRVGAL